MDAFERETLGRLIRQHRLAAHFSKRAFAARIALTPERLTALENGNLHPDLAILARVSDALGISATRLVADVAKRMAERN